MSEHMVLPSHSATSHRGYLARLVLKGDQYGLNGCLMHEKSDPMVEFYVQSFMTKARGLVWDGLDEPWCFVSRYYLSTFLGLSEYTWSGGPVVSGLCLDGGHPEYNIGPDECRRVGSWAYTKLLEKINEAA